MTTLKFVVLGDNGIWFERRPTTDIVHLIFGILHARGSHGSTKGRNRWNSIERKMLDRYLPSRGVGMYRWKKQRL